MLQVGSESAAAMAGYGMVRIVVLRVLCTGMSESFPSWALRLPPSRLETYERAPSGRLAAWGNVREFPILGLATPALPVGNIRAGAVGKAGVEAECQRVSHPGPCDS